MVQRGGRLRLPARTILTASLALGLALFAGNLARAATPTVKELRIEGVINVFTADYIVNGIAGAERDGDALVLITMDTPGGIDTSMRRIIQAILASRLPVAVYVSPGGARAASAGLYVSQAADVIAMAPGTNIGSAHPVFLDTGTGNSPQGSSQDVEGQKVLNDSIAYIQSLASLHGRNADWAASAVRESVNVPAEKALDLHVIDLVSRDRDSLLRDIDGRRLQKNGKDLEIRSAGAAVEAQPMDFAQGLLHALSDPQVAELLLLLAIVAIVFEVTHPGAILPGVVGVISGVLALVAFESLPVSYAGLGLVVFGIVLFAVDVTAPTHGVLTVGGVVSLALGSFMILDAAAPYLEPNIWLAVLPPLAAGVIIAGFISRALAVRRRPPATGMTALVGAVGEAREALSEAGGLVLVDGALWQATAAEKIKPGARVKVKAVNGLQLEVVPD